MYTFKSVRYLKNVCSMFDEIVFDTSLILLLNHWVFVLSCNSIISIVSVSRYFLGQHLMCTFALRSLSRIFTAIFLTCITYFTCSLSSSVTDMHSMMSMRSRLGLGDKYLLTKDHFKDFKGKLLVFSCFSQGIFFGALHLSFQTLLLQLRMWKIF